MINQKLKPSVINTSIFFIILALNISIVAMKEPISLKDQSVSSVADLVIAGKITPEKLKTQVPEELYIPIIKKVILHTAKSAKNLDEALQRIKELSNAEIDADSEFAGEVIQKLADQFKQDINKKLLEGQRLSSGQLPTEETVKNAQFLPMTYEIFVASQLDTPGAVEWLKNVGSSAGVAIYNNAAGAAMTQIMQKSGL